MTEKLIKWFLESPIYLKGKGYKRINSEEKIYPEITAYSVSLAVILYKKFGKDIFKERAIEAINSLIKINKEGAMPGPYFKEFYTFDTSIYISALYDLYSIDKKQIYLDEAEKSLKWLVGFFDGKFKAGTMEEKDWFTSSSIHLVKNSIALLKSKKSEYIEIAKQNLEWGIKLQDENGGFKINEGRKDIFTHAHCYATEAFLFAYFQSRKEKYLDTAIKAAKWLEMKQNKDGSFYKWYNETPKEKIKDLVRQYKVSDATSQAIRIWKLLGINKKGIEKAENYIKSQMEEEDGIRMLRKRFLAVERKKPEVYAWPNFFYLHSQLLPFNELNYAKEVF